MCAVINHKIISYMHRIYQNVHNLKSFAIFRFNSNVTKSMPVICWQPSPTHFYTSINQYVPNYLGHR